MLGIWNLHKSFTRSAADRTPIFSGLDLSVSEEEFVVIVGRNGAGKTTLLNIITGSEQPDSGRLVLVGQDITQMPAHLRSRFIGRVYQNPGLGVSPSLTVLENLALAAARGGTFNLAPGVRRRNIQIYTKLLSDLEMGLENLLHHKAGQLSGGQKQALALTMVVMAKPRLLLLDEHTAALDPGAAERINRVTNFVVMRNRLAALMVTHDLDQALEMGSRLIMLDRGKIVLDVSGSAKKRLTIPDLLPYYETPAKGRAS